MWNSLNRINKQEHIYNTTDRDERSLSLSCLQQAPGLQLQS